MLPRKLLGLGLLVAGLACYATAAHAQTGPYRAPYPPAAQPASPDQPVNPQIPTLERRMPPANYPGAPATPPAYAPGPAAAAPAAAAGAPLRPGEGPAVQPMPGPPPRPVVQAPAAPFDLTAQELAELERVLKLWEQRNNTVKTFECRFKRWSWNRVFGPANAPQFEDLGVIKYASPDRGVFELTDTVVYDPSDVARANPKQQKIEPERADHWICDGKSVYEYKPKQKTVIEYPLPPNLQGKAIANSPLPFLFGSKAEDLKRRYFLRIVTPKDAIAQQTWIEAYPRYQQDAANFGRAILALSNQNMQPFGMQIYDTNEGKSWTSYQFFEITVNDPLRIFRGDPFRASTPIGWKAIVQQPNAAQQANRPAPPGTR